MIAIIDYQMGNLRSVQKGFERVGHEAVVTNDAAVLAAAEKIVLPGVGAFGDAMAEIRRRDLVRPISDAIAEGKSFLGLCLGLQLLFDVSYEGGEHEGLGVIPGKVIRFDLPAGWKVPHMGWNQGQLLRDAPVLRGIADDARDGRPYFYFVHSYYVVPEDPQVTCVQTEYGLPFCAMIWRDNLYATQFHPEKSQASGLRILKNFGDLPVRAAAE
ncbi:MAG: imidazole glycerol phosphate synthase subunit HisH [Pirellulaceae bacterium]